MFSLYQSIRLINNPSLPTLLHIHNSIDRNHSEPTQPYRPKTPHPVLYLTPRPSLTYLPTYHPPSQEKTPQPSHPRQQSQSQSQSQTRYLTFRSRPPSALPRPHHVTRHSAPRIRDTGAEEKQGWVAYHATCLPCTKAWHGGRGTKW
jgi:hypothetical protein